MKTIKVKSISDVDTHLSGAYRRVVKHCLLERGYGYAWKDGKRIGFKMEL